MPRLDPERRLAAILSADAVGYSRLMAEDEAATIRTISAYRHEIAGLIDDHRGRVIDMPGDNVLAVFPTAMDAVECAIEIQRVLKARNESLSSERRMEFRIGVHVEEVAEADDHLYGDGVNIAAGLERLAGPGGICISHNVYELIQTRLALDYEDLGDQQIKNLPHAVRAYGIGFDTVPQPAEAKLPPPVRHWRLTAGVFLALAALVVILPRVLDRGDAQNPEDPGSARDLRAAPSALHSLTVLPFANLSGDPKQEFFADGISEELLNALAKLKGLRVTSRTSAFSFKGKDVSLPELAAKLGVEHVLEGSVRIAGDRVRITAQLIDVETDSHLWTESYDRELSDIFAVQDEIAAKVAEALKIALLGADSTPIRPSPETSIEAYSDYLLARQKLASISYANAREAERLLQSVIERDPGYAPAYAALAAAYWGMTGWGMISASEAAARMRPVAEQALALDDRLAQAWQQLAFVRQVGGDLAGARAAEEKALALDPRNPVVLISQILRWKWTHQPERGFAYADELLRVDPLSPPGLLWVANLYGRVGRFGDMKMMIERIGSIDPQNTYYLGGSSFFSSSRGDLAATLQLLEEQMRIDVGDPEVPSGLALAYSDLGDIKAAEFWARAALQLDPQAPYAKLTAALLHLYENEDAEAVAIARELTQLGSHNRFAIRGIALRMLVAPDLAAGDYEEMIARYREQYPELAAGEFPTGRLTIENSWVWEPFMVTLDLASAYLHAGQEDQAEALFSLVEAELPHWSKTAVYGYGLADVELHALRGEHKRALKALRVHAAEGMGYMWRWLLFHNPHLEAIRQSPEFAKVVADIERDMAAQLARVGEMQRRGVLAVTPELDTAANLRRARP